MKGGGRNEFGDTHSRIPVLMRKRGHKGKHSGALTEVLEKTVNSNVAFMGT